MAVKVLLFILCVTDTLQHLSYPINYCNMASTCIHDGRSVCASSPDGCSRKSFIDQCDMYEYNCDYGTRYQETYILFCGTFIPTQLTETQSSMTKIPTITGINKGMLITTMLPKNVTSKSNVSETDNDIKPNTSPATKLTSKVTPSTQNNSKENVTNKNDNNEIVDKTPVYSTIVKNNSKEDVINENNNTIVNYTTPPQCCNRPLTWETTTKIKNILEDISIENNILSEQITGNSIEYNITNNLNDRNTELYENENYTTLTTTHQISGTVKLKGGTEIYKKTETDETHAKTETHIEITKQTTQEQCCNRPLTWETTTEVTNILTIQNDNSPENIDKTRQTDKNYETDTTSYTTSKHSTSTKNLKLRLTTPTKLQFSHIDCDEKCTCCQNNNDYTTTTTEETNVTSSEEVNKLLLTTIIPKSSVKNWNGCGRPVTWETTSKGETRDFFRVLNE